MGVYLVILDFELDSDLVLEFLDLDPPLETPLPPPLPLASDNSTITRVTKRTRNTELSRILADDKNPAISLVRVFGNALPSQIICDAILITDA